LGAINSTYFLKVNNQHEINLSLFFNTQGSMFGIVPGIFSYFYQTSRVLLRMRSRQHQLEKST